MTPIEHDSKYDDVAEALRAFAEIMAANPRELPESSVRPLLLEALEAARRRDLDAALSGLIEIIRRDRWYYDDFARTACIALFKVLGEEHAVTQRHRKDFNRALY